MVQKMKFWDKAAKGYAKSPIKNEQAYQKKLEITQEYLQPNMEVFEFACGTGTTAIAHAPYVKHILAIDISSKMLEIAQRKAAQENINNITFQQSTIEEFSSSEAAFDVVMAHSILHLLEDPESTVKKVHQLLKPDGVFVTSTVCLGDWIFPWKILIGMARFFRVLPYIGMLKRTELEKYFTDNGFKIDYQWEPRKKEAAFIIVRKTVK